MIGVDRRSLNYWCSGVKLPDAEHYNKMLEVKNELAKQISTRVIAADELRQKHDTVLSPVLKNAKTVLTGSHFSEKSTTPEAESSQEKAVPVPSPSSELPTNNINIYINNNVNKSSEIAYCEKCPLKKERELRYVENEGSGSNGIMLVGQCPGEIEIKRRRPPTYCQPC